MMQLLCTFFEVISENAFVNLQLQLLCLKAENLFYMQILNTASYLKGMHNILHNAQFLRNLFSFINSKKPHRLFLNEVS